MDASLISCPPTTSLYAELKSWQSSIGTGFGFIALVAGALLNFHLNRRRDANLRRDEAISVAAAIYGEIVLLRKEAARLAAAVANVHIDVGTQRHPIVQFDNHFLDAHILSEPMLYKALAPKLGLLDADLILAITEFHKNLQEARRWLTLLPENEARKYTYGPSYVLVPARNAVQKIVPALRKIEIMAGIHEHAPEKLDMGNTDTVIDMEEELWDTPAAPS
jgi:hypothetical protein